MNIIHTNSLLLIAAFQVVIECLVAQRDRVRLKVYTDKLTPHTPDYYKSITALNNAVRQCFSFPI